MAALAAVSFSACDLDVVPPDALSAESYWKTQKDAWYALNEIYINGMPDFSAGISDEMYTDNAHSHKPWEGPFEEFQQGGITAGESSGYDYTTIRLVNNYLANVDKCNISDELKTRTKAEARFFRAWSYLNMVVKFGGVPLVEDVLAYNAPNVARTDVATVQKFILDELQDISTQLPESYAGSGEMYETGRVTRYAALALRARAALDFGNYTEAEKSADAVINSGHYRLFTVNSLTDAQKKEADEMKQLVDFDKLGIDKDAFVKGMFSYEGVWQGDNGNVSDPEVILSHEYMNDANDVDWARYQYLRPSQLVTGYSSYEPLPDLVEAYWNADGKTLPKPVDVDKNAAAYDSLYSNTVAGLDQHGYIAKVPSIDLSKPSFMQQFRNRDSRLYASILFPFKGWHVTDFGTFYYRWDPAWAGSNGNESWTGFSFRKMVAIRPFDTGWGENYSYDDYPLIRYAEVLLTAAESHVVNSGYDDTARSLLNQLRKRCGMPEVPESFTSKDDALTFIRNERRIELAGEGQRFADMRRYGKEYCQKVMTGTSYAINKYVIVNKSWNDKNMLFPIPTSAMDLNPLLEQNPGY